MTEPYTIVIGLEVHTNSSTHRYRLFCRCSTKFGAPPNTQTCPICIGMPGTLPVMNREAFLLGRRTAVALNCQIAKFTKWDRKQYYYPDLPKGYQISQYDLPFSHDGWLEISDPKGRFETKKIGIIRAHLEEDAGKSMHDEQAGVSDSRIDLNRAGTPLLEIVSQPDMRSPAEAKAYLSEMKLLLTYLGVSDCNMQEGSLRVDANINLHVNTPEGKVATPIVEVKNMNSFRAVERAMEYEAVRQYQVWQEKHQKLGDVPKQTRGWDDAAEVTRRKVCLGASPSFWCFSCRPRYCRTASYSITRSTGAETVHVLHFDDRRGDLALGRVDVQVDVGIDPQGANLHVAVGNAGQVGEQQFHLREVGLGLGRRAHVGLADDFQ